jgi:glycogen operon protein
MKSVVADLDDYDWEGDRLLMRPFATTVIYEAHVAGMTKNPNSGVAPEKRGTYAGLIEKIPYLMDLGITAIELMPVFQFDEQDAPPAGRTTGGMPLCLSSLLTAGTVPGGTTSAPSTNSGTW